MYRTNYDCRVIGYFEVRGFDKIKEKDDGSSWGLFHNKSLADIMLAELSRRFTGISKSFYIKEIC